VGEAVLAAPVGAVVGAVVGACVGAMVGADVTVAAPVGEGVVVFWSPVLLVQAAIADKIAIKIVSATTFFIEPSLYSK